MNKQEAIETIEAEWLSLAGICLQDITDIINMIDEPQKPVIPEFVAEWIEWCKTNNVTLLGGISPIDELGSAVCNDKRVESLTASSWTIRNQDTFARAWLDGYTVEEEKLYTVEIPNPNNTSPKYKLMLVKGTNGVEILRDYYNEKRDPYFFQLTESEIKQDFEWAWQFAEEVK